MKPVLFSEVEAKETGTGWTRVGTEMTYFKDIKASEASLSVAVSQLVARNMIIWLLLGSRQTVSIRHVLHPAVPARGRHLLPGALLPVQVLRHGGGPRQHPGRPREVQVLQSEGVVPQLGRE